MKKPQRQRIIRRKKIRILMTVWKKTRGMKAKGKMTRQKVMKWEKNQKTRKMKVIKLIKADESSLGSVKIHNDKSAWGDSVITRNFLSKCIPTEIAQMYTNIYNTIFNTIFTGLYLKKGSNECTWTRHLRRADFLFLLATDFIYYITCMRKDDFYSKVLVCKVLILN